MTDIENFEGKTIEQMGVDTLQRYVLTLKDRLRLQQAHEDAKREEQERVIEGVLRRVVPQVIQQDREQQEKHASPYKFIDVMLKHLVKEWEEFRNRRDGKL